MQVINSKIPKSWFNTYCCRDYSKEWNNRSYLFCRSRLNVSFLLCAIHTKHRKQKANLYQEKHEGNNLDIVNLASHLCVCLVILHRNMQRDLKLKTSTAYGHSTIALSLSYHKRYELICHLTSFNSNNNYSCMTRYNLRVNHEKFWALLHKIEGSMYGKKWVLHHVFSSSIVMLFWKKKKQHTHKY